MRGVLWARPADIGTRASAGLNASGLWAWALAWPTKLKFRSGIGHSRCSASPLRTAFPVRAFRRVSLVSARLARKEPRRVRPRGVAALQVIHEPDARAQHGYGPFRNL